jgi:hypothetical protein
VRLDSIGRARRGRDRAAQQDVVGEDEVGGELGANGGGVRLDVALALLGGELLEQPRLEPFVTV